MTLIALTCQNRIEITPHAGQCRRFLVCAIEGAEIGEPQWLELPPGQSLHDSGQGPHPLDRVDWLISAGMGDGLRRRLAARGVRTLLTTERDPQRALQRFVAGELPDEGDELAHDGRSHATDHDHEHAHHGHGGCGGCGCRH